MAKKSNKISTRWISTTRDDFKAFLKETGFPAPDRLGERGPTFKYPEWLIMFIAVLSVKMKLKAYVQIHRMAVQYWEVIAKGSNAPCVATATTTPTICTAAPRAPGASR